MTLEEIANEIRRLYPKATRVELEVNALYFDVVVRENSLPSHVNDPKLGDVVDMKEAA